MISLGANETFTPSGGITPSIYGGLPAYGGGGLLAQNMATLARTPNISPLATGSNPSIPQPRNTAATNTSDAIQTGQNVNAQLPGYNQDLTNVGANIQSETAGQLPQSVITQLQQQGAERGIGTGTAGSGGNNAAYLQALGLTSLNLTGLGQSQLNQQTQNLPGAAISQNPNFYVSPGQQQAAAAANAEAQAAPNPYFAAQAGLSATQAGYNAGGATGTPVTTAGKLPPTPGGALDTGLTDFNSSPIVMGAGSSAANPNGFPQPGTVPPTSTNDYGIPTGPTIGGDGSGGDNVWDQILQTYGQTVAPYGTGSQDQDLG